MEKDVSRDPVAAQEMVRRSGQMGVPVIAVDQQTIVGFDQPRLEQVLTSSAEQPFRLGASVADATSGGAYVGRVRPASPAERAGIKTGDIIVAVNGQTVVDSTELEKRLASLRPGGTIGVRRAGAPIDLRVAAA